MCVIVAAAVAFSDNEVQLFVLNLKQNLFNHVIF